MIDKLFDVPCKILHVNTGDELIAIVDGLINHFERFGSPVMMGGDVDCSSKGVMGIHVVDNEASLLIVVSNVVIIFKFMLLHFFECGNTLVASVVWLKLTVTVVWQRTD